MLLSSEESTSAAAKGSVVSTESDCAVQQSTLSWTIASLCFVTCSCRSGLFFSRPMIFASTAQFSRVYLDNSLKLFGGRTRTWILLSSSSPSSLHLFKTQSRRLLSEKYHGPSLDSGPTSTCTPEADTAWATRTDQVFQRIDSDEVQKFYYLNGWQIGW